ncbi:MAG TPA: hypothetical protein VMV19_10105 [Xanthobacteraceae bacterium]|nr:hypothetical protein [Xanthobacteraceae bacterium]
MITYPSGLKAKHDSIVARMSKSLRTGKERVRDANRRSMSLRLSFAVPE